MVRYGSSLESLSSSSLILFLAVSDLLFKISAKLFILLVMLLHFKKVPPGSSFEFTCRGFPILFVFRCFSRGCLHRSTQRLVSRASRADRDGSVDSHGGSFCRLWIVSSHRPIPAVDAAMENISLKSGFFLRREPREATLARRSRSLPRPQASPGGLAAAARVAHAGPPGPRLRVLAPQPPLCEAPSSSPCKPGEAAQMAPQAGADRAAAERPAPRGVSPRLVVLVPEGRQREAQP